MTRRYRWYDPISYQFSYSCICESQNSLQHLLNVYLSIIDDVKDYLLREIEGGRTFQGTTSKTVFPMIRTAEDLAIYRKHLCLFGSKPLTHASLFSQGFVARDAVPAKEIEPDWKHAVELLTGNDQSIELPAGQRQQLLQQFMNGFSDESCTEAFPSRCFPPSFTPFFMEIRALRCQTKEEYELFRESGIVREEDSSKLFSFYRLYVIHASIPRSWFRHESAFPLQDKWIKRLKELCSLHRISAGSIKADIMYCLLRDDPLYTYQRTFKIGFCKRIGDIGWALCMSKEQMDLLGGVEKIQSNAGFDIVEQVSNEHVYAQLTPELANIPQDKLLLQWTAIEPYLSVANDNLHSILDIPIALRLGIQSRNIELTEYEMYCIMKNKASPDNQ